MTFITTLIEAITTGITALITPIVTAVHEGFLAFLYGDTAGTESQVVSDLAIFLMVFFGVSIGVGLVWLAISLFKRRR